MLDVGTGSGYAAAVLDELAASVVSVERIARLAERARRALAATGHDAVEVRVADGSLGAPDRAPFDAIAVAAATRDDPARPLRPARGGRPDGAPARRPRRSAAGPRRSGRSRGRSRPRRSAAGSSRLSRAEVGERRSRSAMCTAATAGASRRAAQVAMVLLARPGADDGQPLRRPLGSPAMDERTVTTERGRADGRCAPPAGELGAARQVLRRRRHRLRRQPGRLHAAAPRARLPLRAGRDRLVPRRRHEQLPLEPHLDVPPAARAPRACRGFGSSSSRRSRSARTCSCCIFSCAPASARSSRRRSRSSSSRRSTSSATSCGRSGTGADTSLTRAVALLAVLASLAGAAGAMAATPPAPPGVESSFAARDADPRLTEDDAVERFLDHPKVERWLERYPPSRSTDATFDGDDGTWTVHVWSGKAGEVARGEVSDTDGRVTEAWTGPQVAWQMARGRPGAFGGKLLNSWPVWLGLSAVFLLGLADLRRPLSLHTLDLLALLSFGISLAFFNRGEVFRSAALAVPPLVYLLARTAWIGFHRRRSTDTRATALADVAPGGGHAVPRRVSRRSERRAAAHRDRRRVRGRDRRRPDPGGTSSVRRDAGRRRARVRAAQVGRPDP